MESIENSGVGNFRVTVLDAPKEFDNNCWFAEQPYAYTFDSDAFYPTPRNLVCRKSVCEKKVQLFRAPKIRP